MIEALLKLVPDGASLVGVLIVIYLSFQYLTKLSQDYLIVIAQNTKETKILTDDFREELKEKRTTFQHQIMELTNAHSKDLVDARNAFILQLDKIMTQYQSMQSEISREYSKINAQHNDRNNEILITVRNLEAAVRELKETYNPRTPDA